MIILFVIAAGHESTEKGKRSLKVQFVLIFAVNLFIYHRIMHSQRP